MSARITNVVNACETSLSETSVKVIPGQQLQPLEKNGLELVSRLQSGRDVVLAIDLTESVGLNDEGRIRLRQIVEDSLKPGDTVYVVPFSTDVVISEARTDVKPFGTPIKFINKDRENIDKVLNKIPFASDPNLYGTDIQHAELIIYQGVAQLNQNRLRQNQPVKPQSVIWISDAPLLISPGITSKVWTETPASSPFRIANSKESQERLVWIKDALPLNKRSKPIKTEDNKNYNLSVVDIAPTVQEFCTPAPGGEQTCLVTPYLIRQLWFPGLILLLVLTGLVFGIIKFNRLLHRWELVVDFKAIGDSEDQVCRLSNNKRIAIGEYDSTCEDSIDCPGTKVRGYLERKGEKLYLVPADGYIYYNGQEITSRTAISKSQFRINCPDGKRDHEIFIKVKK